MRAANTAVLPNEPVAQGNKDKHKKVASVFEKGVIKINESHFKRESRLQKELYDKENIPIHACRNTKAAGSGQNVLENEHQSNRQPLECKMKSSRKRVPLRQLSKEEVFHRDGAVMAERRRRISGDDFTVEIESSLVQRTDLVRSKLLKASRSKLKEQEPSYAETESSASASPIRVYNQLKSSDGLPDTSSSAETVNGDGASLHSVQNCEPNKGQKPCGTSEAEDRSTKAKSLGMVKLKMLGEHIVNTPKPVISMNSIPKAKSTSRHARSSLRRAVGGTKMCSR